MPILHSYITEEAIPPHYKEVDFRAPEIGDIYLYPMEDGLFSLIQGTMDNFSVRGGTPRRIFRMIETLNHPRI